MSEYTPHGQYFETMRADQVASSRNPEMQRVLADEWDRMLAAHDAEVLTAERERIIQDMQERSHPDDWGVPCVYVKSYAARLRGEQR